MWPNVLWVLTIAAFFAHPTRALSSWYTEPGGTPTGSVEGDKVRGVNLGGWFILENWMMPSVFEDSIVRDTYINDEVGVARFSFLLLSKH